MKKHVIRIFISSTFKNFHDERDALDSKVYSELEKWCKNRGFILHMMDLRWGVSQKDSAEGRAMEVCLNEIWRCQEASPELNFLIMMGDSYGSKLLPAVISPEEWHFLTDGLKPEILEMLRCRYCQDRNDLRENYVLLEKEESLFKLLDKSRASGFKKTGIPFADAICRKRIVSELSREFNEEVREFLAAQSEKKCPKSETGLPPNVTARSLERYATSATELEIREGYLDLQNAPPDRKTAYYNTFIMIKRGSSDDAEKSGEDWRQESKEDRRRAENLKQELLSSVKETPSRVCIYDARDSASVYLDAAKKFLQDAIQNVIDRYQDTPARKETELYGESLESYVPLHRDRCVSDFIKGNAGKTILLLGESGSGKSWFLKRFSSKLKENGQRVVALFNDEQPQGCAFATALNFLIQGLEHCDALSKEPYEQHPNKEAEWFARRLEAIQPGNSVTIILDCVDKIRDYQDPEGELLRTRLPSNVTLILAATSEKNLGLLRHDAHLTKCEMPLLSPEEGLHFLTELLSKRGRCLQPPQLDPILRGIQSQSSVTALEMELLAYRLRNLPSWRELTDDEINFQSLVKDSLFQEKGDTYKILRRHALGFFALSNVGLTEFEVIELLSRDKAVIEEIRRQQPQKRYQEALDNITRRSKIPMALWAMLYSDLRHLLIEIHDGGTGVLKLRHGRLQQEALRILRDDTREYKSLLHIMREYYERQSWILGERKQSWKLGKRDFVSENRRKVSELFPIYERLGMDDELRRNLNEPDCADAYVRCEMRMELLSAFAAHMPADSASRAARIWELLRRKDFLFRLWPDSFLPAAFAELHPDNDCTATHSRPLLSGDGRFFPDLRGECAFALNDENFVAIYTDGQIRIADMNLEILTPIAHDSVRKKCFLYWEHNHLTVRYERMRVCYEFSPEKSVLIERERVEPPYCLTWDDLWTLPKISTEEDWRETDCYRWSGQYGDEIFYRGDDGMAKVRHIFLRPERSLIFRTHGKLVAFILDETELIVADLARNVILCRSKYDDTITHAEWTPSGRKLLLVLRGNILVQLKIHPAHVLSPMPISDKSYMRYQWEKYSDKLNDYARGMYSLISGTLEDIPMFGALSMRYGWVAVYYHSDIGGKVKVYRLENLKITGRLMEAEVDIKDSLDAPLYPARDRNGLVIEKKKPILFDLSRQKALPAPTSACRNSKEPPCYSSLRKHYADYMAKKLHLRTSLSSERGLVARIRNFFHGDEEQLATLAYRKLLNAEIIDGKGVFWLIDRENSMIHAFDESENVIFRDMLGRRILAADSIERNLYLLLEGVNHVMEIRLI